MNINKIMKMLDWNNDQKIQDEGIFMAEQVNCLSLFMQPMDKQFNKNVWENCAIILSKKEDELLTPYLFKLLDWLKDLNWPGAYIILERLQSYRDYEMLRMVLEDRIRVANALGDKSWLSNLAELIICNEVKQKLSNQVYKIIERYL